VVLSGARLEPIVEKPFSPVLVAYSTTKLIQGHNGIFTDQFEGFLTDYAAYVEGKRMVVRCLASPVCVERLTSHSAGR